MQMFHSGSPCNRQQTSLVFHLNFSHSAAAQQETRYVFLPDHDRDFLLMKAAATHRAVERGRERAEE